MLKLSTILFTIEENEVAYALYCNLFIVLMIDDSLYADRVYIRLAHKKSQNIIKKKKSG